LNEQNQNQELKEIIFYGKCAIVGLVIGLILGNIFDDNFSYDQPELEGLTRFIAGFGDTIGGFIGIVWWQKIEKRKSVVYDFALGAIIGTLVAITLHVIIVVAGLSQNNVVVAIYAIAYSNADNWGGVISCLIKYLKKNRLKKALAEFKQHELFSMANFYVLICFALIDVTVRLLGVATQDYFYAALEGGLLNLDTIIAVEIYKRWQAKTKPTT
jgi:hypothetical protein